MSHKDNVKKWYSLLNARWYDSFIGIWTKLTSRKASKELIQLLKNNVKPYSKILELGHGTGINVGRILDLGLKFKQYTGYDFSDEMRNIAIKKYGKKKNVSFIKKDITSKLGSEKYDLIISTWVMSHLIEPSKVINKCYSHLNKNGIIVFIFLTKPAWFINFWFYFLARLFAVKLVSEEEISKIKGNKQIKKYHFGLTTLLIIRK